MSVIGDEQAVIVAALQAVGIPATADPALVWALASQSDVAALLDWPTELELAFGRDRLRFDQPVWLVSRGPDLQATPRLLAALPAALNVLRPQQITRPDRITQGDVVMPAYLIVSPRQVGCQP